MKLRRLLILTVWILLGLCTVHAQVIVVNPRVKASAISKSDLRDIFSGSSSIFGDGSRAVPVILKGGPVHAAFLKTYVGKDEAAFRATWRSIMFAGQGTMPKVFDSEAALIDYVATVPGAIGYVSGSTNHEKVKSLAVK
jgi:ABC-type phosphate transport system substrate-binding protein